MPLPRQPLPPGAWAYVGLPGFEQFKGEFQDLACEVGYPFPLDADFPATIGGEGFGLGELVLEGDDMGFQRGHSSLYGGRFDRLGVRVCGRRSRGCARPYGRRVEVHQDTSLSVVAELALPPSPIGFCAGGFRCGAELVGEFGIGQPLFGHGVRVRVIGCRAVGVRTTVRPSR